MSRSSKRSRATSAKQPSLDLQSLPPLNDCQVLTTRQWSQLACISTRTAKRLLKDGHGPAIVRLSDKRIGISVGAHRAWLASRERVS